MTTHSSETATLWAERAAQARVMSEEQGRRIAANLPGMVFQCLILPDGGFRFPFVSEGCQAIYGLTPQEITADPSLIVSTIHPEDRDSFTESVGETFRCLTPWRWEGRIVTRTGQIKWVQGTSHPERQTSGAVICEGLLRDVTERREAQEALREAERSYRSIFENALNGIFQTTPAGGYLRANPALARIYGYHTPDALVQGLQDITRQLYVDPERRREFVWLMQEQGAVADFEAQIRRKDESVIWIEEHARAVRDAEGRLLFYEGTVQDITERHESEEALRQAEARYRSIYEHAVEGIFQTTPDGRFLSANPSLARLLGYGSPEEVTASVDPRQSYADPTRRQEFQRLLQKQGTVTGFEAEHHRGDGGLIWLAMSARAVRDGTGTIRYYEGSVEDITERRNAEEALRQAEASYRSIFEHAVEGIYRGTPEGRLMAANPALAQMLGFGTPEELLTNLGQTSQNYVDPQRQADFARLMREGDSVVGFEYQVYGRDGGVLWLNENACAVRDGAGRLLYYEGMIQDITHRKNLEVERERLLAEALERADHDPLTGLLNHRAFHKCFSEEAARAEREGTTLAVAVMDLDNFKFFNDSYGHAVGDGVLRRVAAALGADCRPYDTLARFGGDEFALLMPGATSETAAGLLAGLKTALAAVGYRPVGSEVTIPLTLSVGLAVYPEDGHERHQVLEIADARLIHTKTGGSDDRFIESLRSTLLDSVEGFSMLDALVTAVDNKDRYTRRHSEDVMRHALQIGCALGLDEATLRTLQVAALLHDVGKIGVPDRILRKPGRLTKDEFEAVRLHPMMGAVIVGAVAGFEDTLDAVRHHHERWDGGGYPFGLAGTETPLLARIMAVADAFSAMTMDRPYRKGKCPDEARAILAAGAGSQWDPACVAAFGGVQADSTGLKALLG